MLAELQPLFSAGLIAALCNSDKTSLLQRGLNINNEFKDSPRGEIFMTFSLRSGMKYSEVNGVILLLVRRI